MQRVPLQLANDPGRAEAGRTAMHDTFGKPAVGQPAVPLQCIENRLDAVAFLGVALKLRGQFGTAVISAR